MEREPTKADATEEVAFLDEISTTRYLWNGNAVVIELLISEKSIL